MVGFPVRRSKTTREISERVRVGRWVVMGWLADWWMLMVVEKGVEKYMRVYSSYSVLIKLDLLRQAMALTFVLAHKRTRERL